MRVISLLPSATEIVALALGSEPGGPELVGRSHECDYPPALVGPLPKLTASTIKFETSRQVHEDVCLHLEKGAGLYSVDAEELKRLAPDLVFTQSLCDVCSVDLCIVERVCATMASPPTIISLNPWKLEEVLQDVTRAGEAMGTQAATAEVVASLQDRVDAARRLGSDLRGAGCRPSVAFLEWTDPFFIGGHWTPQLIEWAGGAHPLNPTKDAVSGAGKSIAITREALAESDPDLIIVGPCGLDLPATLRELSPVTKEPFWAGLKAVQAGRVAVVDGNQMFNRPGPRLVDALEWLVGLLHDQPELMPADFPYVWWRDDMEVPGPARQ